MTRQEAMELLGNRVSAWTAANGIYVGTLVEITTHKPWRGKVLITGVCSPAQAFEYGRKPRRGFRLGETIEVGGVNIESCAEMGTTYLAALEADLNCWNHYLANPAMYPRIQGIAAESAKIRREQIEAERRAMAEGDSQ